MITRLICLLSMFLLAVAAGARDDVKLQSTRPAVSPDGSKRVIVDRIAAVVDGEPDPFSGRLAIRLMDEQGSTIKQRYVEASQIQVLNSPVWLDDRWAAVSYSITKNSNGMIYYDSQEGRALLMEFVATSRRMAATNSVESELTDLEIEDHASSVTRYKCVTYRNRSVFPIVLKPLPAFRNAPFPMAFVEDLLRGVEAFTQFKQQNNVRQVDVEQASESFDEGGKMMAILACTDRSPTCVIIPTTDTIATNAFASAKLVRLSDDVTVFACEVEEDALTESSSLDEETTEPDRFRFATSWKGDNVVIEKEVFDVESEHETPKRVATYEIAPDGAVAKVATAQPEPTPPPAEPNSQEEMKQGSDSNQSTATSTKPAPPRRSRPLPRRETPEKKATTVTPKITPTATAAPATPTPQRRSFLRRLVPGGEKPADRTPEKSQ